MLDSYFSERKMLLDYLFKHKNIDNTVYSLNRYSLANPKDDIDMSFKSFYYQDSLLTYINFYTNRHFFFCLLRFSNSKDCVGEKPNQAICIYKIKRWFYKTQFEYIKNNTDTMDASFNLDGQKKYIKANLLSFIQKYSKTKFYIITPPLSRNFYKFSVFKNYFNYLESTIYFTKFKILTKWILEQTKKYNNVEFYGFNTTSYPDNYKNYIDNIHSDMNSMQLDTIKNNTNKLTLDNYRSALFTHEEKIQLFDMKQIKNIVTEQKKRVYKNDFL
ncbi:TPA: hypothetical protein RZK19_000095 [Campylobacter coli]|nr:hypothetical protein [Campylobacter coli]